MAIHAVFFLQKERGYLKSSSLNFDWRKIERNVPIGISLLCTGTMVVNIGLPYFRYFWWLPL
ncbi:hypothetical protein A3J56_02930 [Candidatus Giovannonibacteria bacterium RIFCSPHIGHO2_02_FULL_46_20]|uniref:Uncharacterized protein n=1 Tax=Candidatus Giovannonibacteria bacterium RIFCSPHIGHO2_02_FULL_46_20 TaxID=1798338 RepID=A0A1F5WE08_9BACT|nr:MAG: hypothetical protein A3J56_02930 [Candidatus Giovannonibacteria bacterium RIFCSPHIGHO2_02_FULL_46_20]